VFKGSDAVHAIQAALAFHRTIKVETSSGIAIGRTFVGLVGWLGHRTDWNVAGDSVNLSARLMGQCKPGETRCDFETTVACSERGDLVSFEELDPVLLKGKALPTRIFVPRLVTNRASKLIGSSSSVCVGFEKEKSAIEVWLRDHSAQVMQILGDSGLGKTTLLLWTVNLARSMGSDPIFLSPEEGFIPLLTNRGATSLLNSLEHIVSQINLRLLEISALMLMENDLLSELAHAEPSVLVDMVSPASPSLAWRDALVILALFIFFPEKPLLLLIDDAEFWLGSDLHLLSRIAKRKPYLVATTSRHSLASLGQQVIFISAMDSSTLLQIIKSHRGLSGVADEIIDALLVKTNGVPNKALQIFDALLVRGLVHVESGNAVLSKREDRLMVPADLSVDASGALDSLSPEERNVLKICALLSPGLVDASLVRCLLSGLNFSCLRLELFASIVENKLS